MSCEAKASYSLVASVNTTMPDDNAWSSVDKYDLRGVDYHEGSNIRINHDDLICGRHGGHDELRAVAQEAEDIRSTSR